MHLLNLLKIQSSPITLWVGLKPSTMGKTQTQWTSFIVTFVDPVRLASTSRWLELSQSVLGKINKFDYFSPPTSKMTLYIKKIKLKKTIKKNLKIHTKKKVLKFWKNPNQNLSHNWETMICHICVCLLLAWMWSTIVDKF